MSAKKVVVADNIRQLIIRDVNSGLSKTEVAAKYQVNPKTLWSIVKRYEITGDHSAGPRGKKSKKLSIHHINQLCDWVDEDVCITLKQLTTCQ